MDRKGNKKKDMKIICVHKKYFYGQPELGLSNIYRNYYTGLAEMNNRTVETIFFPVDILMKEKGPEGAREELRHLILKEKPDLIYWGFWPEKELIRETAPKSGAVSFDWHFDDHGGFYKSSKGQVSLYNWIFTTDPQAPEKYRKIGYRNAVFMPPAYNHLLYKPLDLPKIYDVSFVGHPHGSRKKIVEKLRKAGINVVCFGPGWPNGPIAVEDKVKLISQSKINLSFSESSGTLWKQLGLIFLKRNSDRSLGINSPLKWYDSFQMLLAQRRRQIKGRIFKVTGCGGFLLTGYAEEMEKLYEPGKELVLFSNFNDLVRKIKYYLAHDEERERIARAGYERSLRDHTCEKRFNEMFRIMGFKNESKKE